MELLGYKQGAHLNSSIDNKSETEYFFKRQKLPHIHVQFHLLFLDSFFFLCIVLNSCKRVSAA